MRIYFNDTKIVKGLAKKLVREVRSWGDTIKWMNALTVVARAFGHDEYEDLVKTVGFANPSPSDQSVDPKEAALRYEQYVSVIADSDFTRDEAVKIVGNLRMGGWWGFDERSEPLSKPKIKASENRMEFRDVSAVEQFNSSLRLALRACGFKISIGARKLSAKLFGYDDYAEFEASAGRGVPTPSDFYVSPQELDRRVEEYLRVLMDVGLEEGQAIRLLYEVGAEGWWHLQRTNAGPDVRHAKFVDRIEGTGSPTWKPNGRRNSYLHRTPRPPKKVAYVLFANEHPYDEVHIWALLPGEEICGYCDDELGNFLDRIDLSLRAEVASVYREILIMPDARAEIMIVRDATRGDQRVDELYLSNGYHKKFFENYSDFTQQDGQRLFRRASSPEAVVQLQTALTV